MVEVKKHTHRFVHVGMSEEIIPELFWSPMVWGPHFRKMCTMVFTSTQAVWMLCYLQAEDCQWMVNGRLGDISSIFSILISTHIPYFHIFPTYFNNPSIIYHPHSPSVFQLILASKKRQWQKRVPWIIHHRPLRLCGWVPARERALPRLSSCRKARRFPSDSRSSENQLLEHPLEHLELCYLMLFICLKVTTIDWCICRIRTNYSPFLRCGGIFRVRIGVVLGAIAFRKCVTSQEFLGRCGYCLLHPCA